MKDKDCSPEKERATPFNKWKTAGSDRRYYLAEGAAEGRQVQQKGEVYMTVNLTGVVPDLKKSTGRIIKLCFIHLHVIGLTD